MESLRTTRWYKIQVTSVSQNSKAVLDCTRHAISVVSLDVLARVENFLKLPGSKGDLHKSTSTKNIKFA